MDEPIIRVVSKYRIQMESNGLLYSSKTLDYTTIKKSAQNNTNTETKTK